MVKIRVFGITGRMGKRVVACAERDDRFELAEDWEVGIDFTAPEALDGHLKLGKPLVIGTTGLKEEHWNLLNQAAKRIPVLISPNFCLGVPICLEAVKQMAEKFGGSCEIEEIHHVHKKDKPSGTALAFQNAVGRKVPIKSIREGEAIGEHKIIFTCRSERIELTHRALDRDAFAKGALEAALFLSKQPPGLYTLFDFLRGDVHHTGV